MVKEERRSAGYFFYLHDLVLRRNQDLVMIQLILLIWPTGDVISVMLPPPAVFAVGTYCLIFNLGTIHCTM